MGIVGSCVGLQAVGLGPASLAKRGSGVARTPARALWWTVRPLALVSRADANQAMKLSETNQLNRLGTYFSTYPQERMLGLAALARWDRGPTTASNVPRRPVPSAAPGMALNVPAVLLWWEKSLGTRLGTLLAVVHAALRALRVMIKISALSCSAQVTASDIPVACVAKALLAPSLGMMRH